jgi:hypothetical protein
MNDQNVGATRLGIDPKRSYSANLDIIDRRIFATVGVYRHGTVVVSN